MKHYRHKLNTIGYGQYMLLFGILMLALGLICRFFGLQAISCICLIAGGMSITIMFLLVAIELHQDKILNAEAIAADSKLEAAVQKKSFALPYNGGMIWAEHLDGLYTYKDKVLKKFDEDKQHILKPSAPSAIAVALAETKVDEEILRKILEAFAHTEKRIYKVAFIGLDARNRKLLKQIVRDGYSEIKFAMHCTGDFENAKEWLIS